MKVRIEDNYLDVYLDKMLIHHETVSVNRNEGGWPQGDIDIWNKIAAAVNRDGEVKELASKLIGGEAWSTFGSRIVELYKPKPLTVGDLKIRENQKVLIKPYVGIFVRPIVDKLINCPEGHVIMLNKTNNGVYMIAANFVCEPAEDK